MKKSTYIAPLPKPIDLVEYWSSESAAFEHHSPAVRDELALANAVLQFFQAIVIQSPVKTNPEERAVFELIHAATRHYATAVTLAARGHTSEVLCVMRSVIEAVDDARRVHINPKVASAWLKGSREFKASTKKLPRFQGPTQDLRKYYDQYCEYGSHPNVAVGQSLFDVTNPNQPVLSFHKRDSNKVRVYLVNCGLAGYDATSDIVIVLWPNVRPPDIFTRAGHLHVLRDGVLKRWKAQRRSHRLVTV